MNLTDYAKQMGTSKTTLYRKIGESGIDPATLRGPDGQITDDGYRILSGIMDGTLQRHRVSQPGDVPQNDVTQAGKIVTLEREIAETRAALEAANARIAELQRQALDRERENAEAWRRFSERQQQIEAQRLLVADVDENRRGLFRRIHDRLFGRSDPRAGGPDDTTGQT